MPFGGTDQSGSTVAGDQVGRDKITQEAPKKQPRAASSVAASVEQFQKEVADDAALGEVIDTLQHFLDNVDADPAMDLASKLRLGGRETEIREAQALKELFAKRVHRFLLSPSAQTIFSYLLGRMHQMFRYKIRPLVENGKSAAEVDEKLFEFVIMPVQEIVDKNEVPLQPQEILGMLYYLTGNCHIKWHADARVSSGS
jgi:hypothetical protein